MYVKCFSFLTVSPSLLRITEFLLQQRHPLSLGIPTAAGDAVQVYATGHTGARNVGAVPHCLIASDRLHLIHQSYHLLTQKVVHRKRDVGLLRHLVADSGGRIERGGGG